MKKTKGNLMALNAFITACMQRDINWPSWLRLWQYGDTASMKIEIPVITLPTPTVRLIGGKTRWVIRARKVSRMSNTDTGSDLCAGKCYRT